MRSPKVPSYQGPASFELWGLSPGFIVIPFAVFWPPYTGFATRKLRGEVVATTSRKSNQRVRVANDIPVRSRPVVQTSICRSVTCRCRTPTLPERHARSESDRPSPVLIRRGRKILKFMGFLTLSFRSKRWRPPYLNSADCSSSVSTEVGLLSLLLSSLLCACCRLGK
jgi:hypothetical protein